MADLARVKRNVAKMVSLGAPETEIDAYISGEGTTVDAVRAFKAGTAEAEKAAMLDAVRADPSLRSTNIEDRRAPPPAPAGPNLEGSIAATLGGLVNGIPIVGPLAQGASDALMGGAGMLMGKDYGETTQALRDRREQLAEQNPLASGAGNLAGSLGSWGAAAKVAPVAMGATGNLLQRMGNSALSSAGIVSADAAVKGEPVGEALTQGGVAGVLGGAIPLVGAGLKAGIGAIGRKLEPTIGAIRDSGKEALRRTGKAFARDAQANPQLLMSGADELAAKASGLPVINADRGGETVRALTRSIANQSPEARAVIDRTASDRFAGQAGRAVEAVRRISGGNVDDLAFQDMLKQAARFANKPAYDKAFADPAGRAVWSPTIRQLMQSDKFRKAVIAAESRGRDKAAITGAQPVRNPFEFGPNGEYTLRINPDGSRALPSLQFWDQVKRNLDGMIDGAQRGAKPDRALFADLSEMKRMLVGELDAAVPSYSDARGMAAKFFGAEDALEAGRKFATATRQLPEAERAIKAMNKTELRAFQAGFASEVIDKIKDARFRANVIDQAFGSPAKREMMKLVFGPAKAREMEAFIRVEEIADKLRNAMGNSTTARQLMELGIGAGSGALLSGGDWKGALTGAALVKGGRMLSQRVDDKVMQEVARLLLSSDPKAMQRAIAQAQLSPMWMDALEDWGRLLGAPARAAGAAVAANAA